MCVYTWVYLYMSIGIEMYNVVCTVLIHIPNESKSDKIDEVFPTRNIMVGISPTVNTFGPVESSAVGWVQALLPFWGKPARVISRTTLLHKHNFPGAPKHFRGHILWPPSSSLAPVQSPPKVGFQYFSRNQAGEGFPIELFHIS